ncbi:leucine-rich repeat-containing protein 72 isoform X2 [Paramormyrops kingsleyae]|nr:leucine-rich repeat-containing protein 72 isoform X2 [Paramormyrops kingsleyae]
MDMCEKEHRKIDVLRRNSGIKRAIDITQLYLANKKMVMIPNLSKFRMLRYLWLNNNMITKISTLSTSCCLTELYLQNNKITSISGTLSHLSCLQVLLLHNNQLESLEESVAELRRAQQLHTLSFFLNPFTENPQYRNYVAHHLPSVLILDRREVKREEKISAFQMFSPGRNRVQHSVAFGRRAEFVPIAGNRDRSSEVQSSDSS